MRYCNVGEKAVVEYKKIDGGKVFFQSKGIIEVSAGRRGTYRFYGMSDDFYIQNTGKFDEFTATGINPGYVGGFGFGNRGFAPAMDGKLIRGPYYYFISDFGFEEIAGTINCQIEITSNGKTFTDTIMCPNGAYNVSCGNECPEGFCKCIIPEYPGYCCLDCSATATQIREITNDLRAKNGR
ncbi:hypothetical protein [Nostoc sp.]|uniref:hypothetical protein n=1 Tax=Nostoc sp. TaxID=1180 RepID=UPI002FF8BB22